MIYQADNLSLSCPQPQIAELLFHAPNGNNILNSATLNQLKDAVDLLEKNTDVNALIIRSRHDNFILGADIHEFLPLFASPKNTLITWLETTNQLFNRIEDLHCPTIALLSGFTLGGGLELALACDFRIATPQTKLGFPETSLGIIPGFGGTVRLPRVIGLDHTLSLMTYSKKISASKGMQLGLIDAVIDKDTLHKQGLLFARELIEPLEKGKPQADHWLRLRELKKSPIPLPILEKKLCMSVAKSKLHQNLTKTLPAVTCLINCLDKTTSLQRDEALTCEHHAFASLVQNPITQALVGNFLNDHYLSQKIKQRLHTELASNKITILGAGIMGTGIAYQALIQGFRVDLHDTDNSALESAMMHIIQRLNQKLQQKKIHFEELTLCLSRFHLHQKMPINHEADIMIEAIVEQETSKSTLLQSAEQKLSKNCLIASNTSSISIHSLASSLQHPDRFCGLHFFNPVDKMPLVEIIRGKDTSEDALNRAVTFAYQLGKKPVIVNDCPGFFINRVLFPYLLGFSFLVSEGFDFVHIDKIMEDFGWPMGPATLLDVIGIDTVYHARQVMVAHYPDRMAFKSDDCVENLYKAQHFGQKSGIGFYQYAADGDTNKAKIPNPSIAAQLSGDRLPPDLTEEDIILRMMAPMINEVNRCLDEHIIESIEEADIALLLGLGFPYFRGGVFRYLDTLDLKQYLADSERFADLSPLYIPPDSLIRHAHQGHSFYFTHNRQGSAHE